MHRSSRLLADRLNDLRKDEESSLSSKSFVATIAKGYRYSILIVCIVGIGMGYLLSVPVQDPAVGIVFGALGLVALLMLPTCFSYQCVVDNRIMKETYYILCFKVSKDVPWKEIEYKRVKRDSQGHALSIRLYNGNKKKLISFDYGIAGLGHIVRMTKRVPTLKR